jgi:hypothetical protein
MHFDGRFPTAALAVGYALQYAVTLVNVGLVIVALAADGCVLAEVNPSKVKAGFLDVVQVPSVVFMEFGLPALDAVFLTKRQGQILQCPLYVAVMH